MNVDADHEEAGPALGTILDEGRGSLPYALIHGESLVACAAWALGDAGVRAVDLGTRWSGIADSAEPFVVHDALCPMTPAAFIASCVERSARTGAVVAGVDAAGGVLSPVVLPAGVVADLADLPSTDMPELVRLLAGRYAVDMLPAPTSAARVTSLADVAALELLTTPEPA